MIKGERIGDPAALQPSPVTGTFLEGKVFNHRCSFTPGPDGRKVVHSIFYNARGEARDHIFNTQEGLQYGILEQDELYRLNNPDSPLFMHHAGEAYRHNNGVETEYGDDLRS